MRGVDLVPVPRRTVLAGGVLAGGVLAAGAGLGGESAAAAPPAPLRRLLAGNRRFVSGASAPPRRTPADIARLRPFAVVLGCSDAVVAPQVVFDQGAGDLVDVRVAGQAVDDLVLGSVEYAVTEFSPTLLLVLGHERCGAVALTVESIRRGAPATGNLGTVVDALRPAVDPAMRASGDPVDNGVRANVGWQIRALWQRSALIRNRVGAGALSVVGARYDVDSGGITLLTRGWR